MKHAFRRDSAADNLNEGFERRGLPAKARKGHYSDFSGCDALLDSYFDEDDWKDGVNDMVPVSRM